MARLDAPTFCSRKESTGTPVQWKCDMEKIRVLIIDEHPAVCRALATRLESVGSIKVVSSKADYTDGLKDAAVLRPDVILLELKGSSEAGQNVVGQRDPVIAISQLLANVPAGVIVLTSYLDESERAGALEAGAKRYLLKDIDTVRLVSEIEAVARERATVVSPDAVQQYTNQAAKQ